MIFLRSDYLEKIRKKNTHEARGLGIKHRTPAIKIVSHLAYALLCIVEAFSMGAEIGIKQCDGECLFCQSLTDTEYI